MMGIKTLLEDNIIKEVPLYEAMGFLESNGITNKVFREIMASKRDMFWLMSLARDIRKWRFIHVCSYCKRYLSGGEWIEGILKADGSILYPQGKQTHGICHECYDKEAYK